MPRQPSRRSARRASVTVARASWLPPGSRDRRAGAASTSTWPAAASVTTRSSCSSTARPGRRSRRARCSRRRRGRAARRRAHRRQRRSDRRPLASARSAGIATSRSSSPAAESPRLRIVPAAGWQRVRARPRAAHHAHPGRRRARPRRDGQGARGRPLRARACRAATGAARSSTSAATSRSPAPAPAGGWPIRVTDDHRSDATAEGQTIALAAGGLATSSTTVRRWRAGDGERAPHRRSAQRRAGARGLAHRQRGRRELRRRPTRRARPRSCAARAPSPGSSAAGCPRASCAATARPSTHRRLARGGRGMNQLAVWYLMRASGAVALLLLTRRERARRRDRQRVCGPGACRASSRSALHRNISLLAVAFLAVHVLTAVDRPRRGRAARRRRGARARPRKYGIWLGLAALALDLVVALVVTSLLRQRIAPRAWRGAALRRLPRLAGRAAPRRRHGHRQRARRGCSRSTRSASRSSPAPSRCACWKAPSGSAKHLAPRLRVAP